MKFTAPTYVANPHCLGTSARKNRERMSGYRDVLNALLVCAVSATSVLVTAPVANASPSPTVAAAVQAARGQSTCGPLRTDSLTQQVADMSIQETSDYKSHRNAAVPFTDPMPALRTVGFGGSKSILLSGYGADEASALHGVLLEGHLALVNCSYSLYGASAARDDEGASLVSVVLAAL